MLVALNRLGPKAHLPELSEARLTLSRLESVTLPGEGGAALRRDLTRYDDAALRAYAW